jgi:hypothetical protein
MSVIVFPNGSSDTQFFQRLFMPPILYPFLCKRLVALAVFEKSEAAIYSPADCQLSFGTRNSLSRRFHAHRLHPRVHRLEVN